jgi:hypothetical protein
MAGCSRSSGPVLVTPARCSRLQRAAFVTEAQLHDVHMAVAPGPRSVANIQLYERHGYRQIPNDTILIRLTKQREPVS